MTKYGPNNRLQAARVHDRPVCGRALAADLLEPEDAEPVPLTRHHELLRGALGDRPLVVLRLRERGESAQPVPEELVPQTRRRFEAQIVSREVCCDSDGAAVRIVRDVHGHFEKREQHARVRLVDFGEKGFRDGLFEIPQQVGQPLFGEVGEVKGAPAHLAGALRLRLGRQAAIGQVQRQLRDLVGMIIHPSLHHVPGGGRCDGSHSLCSLRGFLQLARGLRGHDWRSGGAER